MTRETKVGLIVGLAFNMVFAVILSHKGTQPRAAISSELGPFVDAGATLNSAQTPPAESRPPAGRHAATNPTHTSPAAPARTVAPQPPATEIARTTPGSSLRVPLPDLPQTADAGDSKSVPSTLDLWLDGVSDAVSGATSKIRQAPPAAPVEVKHVDAKSPTVSDPSSLSCHPRRCRRRTRTPT